MADKRPQEVVVSRHMLKGAPGDIPPMLFDLDQEAVDALDLDDAVSLPQTAKLLGVRPREVGELVTAGLLRSERNGAGRAIVTGKDLRRFVERRLEPVEFVLGSEPEAEEAEEESGPEEEVLKPARKPRADLPRVEEEAPAGRATVTMPLEGLVRLIERIVARRQSELED